MGIYKRVKTRIDMMTNAFRDDIKFSYRFAWYRMIDELAWRFRLRKISEYFHRKKDNFIIDYLKSSLHTVIEKYFEDNYIGIKNEDAPVWVCWWSGEEDAPALVKQCIKSIKRNVGANHVVNIVTEKNYADYLDIPDYILQKVKSGTMCIANFSDYLRVSLLEKYGGLWLDATIFCANKVPEEYFDLPLFTCKSKPVESRYLSNFRWTSFCLGGYKNHIFYRFFKEALENYWQKEESSIDYLLVDYLIYIAYSSFPIVRECFDNIKINNIHRDELQAAMNRQASSSEFSDILSEDTVLYKLSWREVYSEKGIDGKESVYAYFLKMDL